MRDLTDSIIELIRVASAELPADVEKALAAASQNEDLAQQPAVFLLLFRIMLILHVKTQHLSARTLAHPSFMSTTPKAGAHANSRHK